MGSYLCPTMTCFLSVSIVFLRFINIVAQSCLVILHCCLQFVAAENKVSMDFFLRVSWYMGVKGTILNLGQRICAL